jgi:hypothetical protein
VVSCLLLTLILNYHIAGISSDYPVVKQASGTGCIPIRKKLSVVVHLYMQRQEYQSQGQSWG